jgi:glycosyltransferase involved in cell wall biosynthesis
MTLVSAIIPAYNEEQRLAGAIESVLAQDCPGCEVIVVDDASTDRTAEIARSYGDPVRCETVAHTGLAGARNHGVRMSSGELIGLLDADDRWLPGKLSAQVEALRARPDAGACFTGTRYVDELSGRVWEGQCRLSEDMVAALLVEVSVLGPPSALLVRRSVLQEAGPFDETLTHSDDWDMWLRLAQVTRFALVPDPLVEYRFHGAQMSKSVPKLEQNVLRILGRFFADPENERRWGHLRRASYASLFWMFAGGYAYTGNLPRAARYLSRSIAMDPAQLARLPAALGKAMRRHRP